MHVALSPFFEFISMLKGNSLHVPFIGSPCLVSALAATVHSYNCGEKVTL